VDVVRRYISTFSPRAAKAPVLVIGDSARVEALLRTAKLEIRTTTVAQLDRALVNEPPWLVVIDDPDGAMMCQRLKGWRPEIPVIVVTADRLEAIRAGADHVLSPPIDDEELVARARRLVAAGERQLASAAKLDELMMWHDWVRYFVHDLRNPINVALNMLSLVNMAHDANGRANHIRYAIRALDDVRMMLQDVLDADRVKRGVLGLQKQRVDLASIVEEVASDIAATADHTIDVAKEGDAEITVDPGLIRRVIANLVINANRHAREQPVRISIAGGALGVSVRVVNDGPGISPALQRVLFEPWRHIEGSVGESTGIGLAFCRLVCEAHGGRIWLDSANDGNVAFAFGLPHHPAG
jgi:signal transduction histidine kinase